MFASGSKGTYLRLSLQLRIFVLDFARFSAKFTYGGLTGLRADEDCNKEASARESSLGLQGLICVRLIDRNKQIGTARTTDRKPLRS